MNIKEIQEAITIPEDKANHIIDGLIVFLVVGAFLGAPVGLAACVVVGAIKETIDKFDGGDPAVLDFVSTFVGGLLGCAIAHFIHF